MTALGDSMRASGIVLLIVLGLASGQAGCGDSNAARREKGELEIVAPPETRLRVRIERVRRARLTGADRVTGTVRAFHRATITAETQGRVLARAVEPGAAVEQDGLLVELESSRQSSSCAAPRPRSSGPDRPRPRRARVRPRRAAARGRNGDQHAAARRSATSRSNARADERGARRGRAGHGPAQSRGHADPRALRGHRRLARRRRRRLRRARARRSRPSSISRACGSSRASPRARPRVSSRARRRG